MQVLQITDDVDKIAQHVTASNINAQNNAGVSALMFANWAGRPRCVDWLLRQGASYNQRDEHGHTALYFAAARFSTECISLMLNAGADVNSINNDGKSPLMYVLFTRGQWYNKRPARLLIDAGASVEYVRDNQPRQIQPWVYNFITARAKCARAAIAVVCTFGRPQRNVARLIGRMIWDTRGNGVWE